MKFFPPAPHRADQVGSLDDGQVLRRRLTRHPNAFAQLSQRLPVVLVQPVQQVPPSLIGQRFEDLVQLWVHTTRYAGKYLHFKPGALMTARLAAFRTEADRSCFYVVLDGQQGKADTMTTTEKITTSERADLLRSLAQARYFLRFTVRDLTDEQAAQRTTVSALCLGGLIKHVAAAEQAWMSFLLGGADAMASDPGDWMSRFQMLEGETLAGLLDHYEEVARRTDEIVATLPDLDVSHPLPEAPWFEPGVSWSARLVLLHVIAETAQHAGHADIIRESLDGSKSMG